MSQVHTWIKYLAFHSVISAHHAASSSSFVFWGCWLCLVDVIFPESLSDIALRRGLELRPKLNDTVWDRGQMVYVHQFSLSPSSIEKKNKVSETLWRVYFGNCKTLLIFRAGLHHRGIFILDGCSCSYSLSSSTAQLTLSKTLQSIDFSGFFFLQTHFFKLPIIQFFVGQQNKWSFSVSAGYIYTWITAFIFVCSWDLSRFLCALVYFFLKSLRCLKFSSKVLVGAPTQWRMTMHSLFNSEKNVLTTWYAGIFLHCFFPCPSTHCYKLTRDTNRIQHSWTTFLVLPSCTSWQHCFFNDYRPRYTTATVRIRLDDFYRLTISKHLIGHIVLIVCACVKLVCLKQITS